MKLCKLLLFLTAVCSAEGQTAFGNVEFVLMAEGCTPNLILLNAQGHGRNDFKMDEFTHCIYAYMVTKTDKKYYTLISLFSREKHRKEVTLYLDFVRNGTVVTIHGKENFISGEAKRDEWTHICYTWKKSTTEIKLYFDGVLIGKKHITAQDMEAKDMIYTGFCIMILGQDQDEYQSDFHEADGMWGRITQFNVWDKVLEKNEINCAKDGKLYGNRVDWRNSACLPGSRAIMMPTTLELGLSDSNTELCEKLSKDITSEALKEDSDEDGDTIIVSEDEKIISPSSNSVENNIEEQKKPVASNNPFTYQDMNYQAGSLIGPDSWKGMWGMSPAHQFPFRQPFLPPKNPQFPGPQVQVQQFAAPVQFSGIQQNPVVQDIIPYLGGIVPLQYPAKHPEVAQPLPAAQQSQQSNQLHPRQSKIEPILNK